MTMKEYPIKRTISANLAKVKEHLSAYIARVEKGERVVICRRNRPAAQLVPVDDSRAENRTKLGSAKGSVVVKCDLTEPAMEASDWEALR